MFTAIKLALVAFVAVCAAHSAIAACPAGSLCEPFSTFTNSVGVINQPSSSTDRVPYVQGAATHYVPGVRQIVFSGPTLYVTSTGSDVAPCTQAAPCVTIQFAVNYILANVDLRSNTPIISVGSGTFAGAKCAGAPAGSSRGDVVPIFIEILGQGHASTTISSSVGPSTIGTGSGCYIDLQSATVQSSSGNAIFPQWGGFVAIDNDIWLGPVPAGFDQLHAETNGGIFVFKSYTVAGGGQDHQEAILGGWIEYNEQANTIFCAGTGNTFAGAFSYVAQNGFIYQNSSDWTVDASCTTGPAAVSGVRYQAHTGGVIETIGGLGTYMPGTLDGFEDQTGTYSPRAKPSAAVTGAGTGATVTVNAGSTNRSGTIYLVTGTTPAGIGTLSLSFADPLGQYAAVCDLMTGFPATQANPQQWAGTRSFNQQGSSPDGPDFNWSTGSGNLVNPGTYQFNYICAPVTGFP